MKENTNKPTQSKIGARRRYLPIRYITAALITVLEAVGIIGVALLLCTAFPALLAVVCLVQGVCVVRIVASDENPDYKVPWLLIVLLLPVIGFFLYFVFYSRKLHPKYVRRLSALQACRTEAAPLQAAPAALPPAVAADATLLCRLSGSHPYSDTAQHYFSSGEAIWQALLEDLHSATRFVFLEFFLVREGVFLQSILDVLKEKAANGVEIRLIYDDVGCMTSLPDSFHKKLRRYGIHALPFSRVRGNADSECNKRNHRKLVVIDGEIAYLGGINLSDEYVNVISPLGHWKDAGVRLHGPAVRELTRLFLNDLALSTKRLSLAHNNYFPTVPPQASDGLLIPFGDGPRPLYARRVGKSVIQSLLAHATRYAWISTPYLIIDNDLCLAIENAALRGADVRILLPHVPDKPLVFAISRSFYPRLMAAGVKILEYQPGFLHAKCYLVDDELALVGSINLDHRSLVHQLECGVWMYRCACLPSLKADLLDTLSRSRQVEQADLRISLPRRALRALLRLFAPLL